MLPRYARASKEALLSEHVIKLCSPRWKIITVARSSQMILEAWRVIRVSEDTLVTDQRPESSLRHHPPRFRFPAAK